MACYAAQHALVSTRQVAHWLSTSLYPSLIKAQPKVKILYNITVLQLERGGGGGASLTCAESLLPDQADHNVQPALRWGCPDPELPRLLLQGPKTCCYGSYAESFHAVPERCRRAAPAQHTFNSNQIIKMMMPLMAHDIHDTYDIMIFMSM